MKAKIMMKDQSEIDHRLPNLRSHTPQRWESVRICLSILKVEGAITNTTPKSNTMHAS